MAPLVLGTLIPECHSCIGWGFETIVSALIIFFSTTRSWFVRRRGMCQHGIRTLSYILEFKIEEEILTEKGTRDRTGAESLIN